MESLALLAAVIVLAIIILGAVSLVVAVRSPRTKWARAVSVVFVVPAVLAGLWLVSLDIGAGGRLIGGFALIAGTVALVRLAKKN